MTDFIVLTGFLGSGKTTLLRDFLALPDAADTAVIVNEVGEIGLDGAILAESGGLPIAALSNGCVCCSLGGDLARTIDSLMATRSPQTPFARIVLETSGLSKPGPVLRSLVPLAPLRMRVGVVATFDCRNAPAADGFEEAAAQWAGAQALVLTKRDLLTPLERQSAREAAAGVNPMAALIDTDDRRAAVLAAFATPAAPPPAVFEAASSIAHPRISVLLARPGEDVSWNDVAEWLDNLAGLMGERLLRLKGVVRCADTPNLLLVQSVGTVFSAPRPFASIGDGRPFLVLILRDSDPAELASLTPCLGIRFTQVAGRA